EKRMANVALPIPDPNVHRNANLSGWIFGEYGSKPRANSGITEPGGGILRDGGPIVLETPVHYPSECIEQLILALRINQDSVAVVDDLRDTPYAGGDDRQAAAECFQQYAGLVFVPAEEEKEMRRCQKRGNLRI